jgi:hypothetical protein
MHPNQERKLALEAHQLRKAGLSDKAISRELDITYWVARRLLSQPIPEVAEEGIKEKPSEVKLPVWIKMINWKLFMPYSVSILTNPHSRPEDRERVEHMLKEASVFLQCFQDVPVAK